MLTGFIDGVRSYGQAFSLITRLRLWRYLLAPALISFLLGIATLGAAWGVSDDIGRRIVAWYPWEGGRGAVEQLATVLGGILVVALGLLVFKHLVLALASPFMSLLSERVERHLMGDRAPIPNTLAKMIADMARGVTIALRNLFRELLLMLLLFLLGLIPLLTPLTTAGIFIVQAYYAGFGNIDYTLERHAKVRTSVRFVRRHRGLAIGNGAVFLLLLFSVVGFLFALPLSTVAATVETVKRLPAEGS